MGRSLMLAWQQTAQMTGGLSQRVGVKVLDRTDGKWRPIGNLGADFFPRRIRSEVRAVIADPKSNPKLFDKLLQDLLDQGRTRQEALAILHPGSEDLRVSNDFMGNLELAREGQLPYSFYEYRFDPIVKGFVNGYAERLAQVATYGQKTEEGTKDLFDEAMERAADDYTRRYIAQAREQGYGMRRDGTLDRFMARASSFATGTLLSNPLSSIRNLISGVYGTTEMVGFTRAVKAAVAIARQPALELDTAQMGVLRANLLDAMFFEDLDYRSKADRALRAGVSFGLKAGGYTGAENFIRRHATAAGMQFVTDGVSALKQWRATPRDRRAKRHALEFLAHAKRLGTEGGKIAAEGLDFRNGLETRAFIRRQIKEAQGGYKFDQVPLWANSPAGRFLYQFGRWGTQRTRALYRSMWEPAFIGTEVEIDGKKVRVRNARPLLVAGAGSVLTGSLFASLADVLFDRDRADASWSEIAERLDKDTADGLAELGDRLMNDVVTGGMLGILGQPIAAGRELTVFNRVRNPLNPPGVQAFHNIMDLVYGWLDSGGPLPPGRTVLRAAEDQFAGYKNVKAGVLNLAAQAGADWDAAKRYQAEQDQRFLRRLSWRFAKDAGIEASRGGIGPTGIIRRTESTVFYDRIQDALLVGDAEEARRVAEEYLQRFEGAAELRRAMGALKATVRSRQPFRVGTHNGDDVRLEFFDWAAEHLPGDQFERLERVDGVYHDAAVQAGLMRPRPPVHVVQRRAALQEQRNRRLDEDMRARLIQRGLPQRPMPAGSGGG
ncbi:MAG: hypothetical protein ACREIA_17140 [Opitutaceae bacterium]